MVEIKIVWILANALMIVDLILNSSVLMIVFVIKVVVIEGVKKNVKVMGIA